MKPKTALHSLLPAAGSMLLLVSSVNATQFWDGTGGDANWNTPENWGGDILPAFGITAINFGSLSSAAGTAFGNVVVPSQTTANNDLTAATVIKGFVFGNTGAANRTQAFTLTGNSIVLGTGLNDGISTTAIAIGGTPIQDIIALDMDINTLGAYRQIIVGLNHSLRIDGVISGSVASTSSLIAARGRATVTFNNTNNSYAGFTNIAEGAVLEVVKMDNGGTNSSIGASSNANANLRFNFGFNSALQTTLRHIGSANSSTDRGFIIYGNVGGGTHSAIESSGLGTLSFTGSASIAFGTAAQPRNLYLGGTNAGDNVFNLAFGNNTTGVNTFTKQGVGKWILSGSHTYTGTTTVSEGTLQFAKQVSLYNNNTAGAGWTAANIKVANTATLALNVGGAGEFDTGNVTTLLTNLGGANGTSTTGFAAGSAIGFDTTNAAGGSFTVADAIANSTGAGGGAIGLTKLGTGTLVLSNANTYTGTTTVSAGTLELGSTGSNAKSSSVAIAAGGTLDTDTQANYTIPGAQPVAFGINASGSGSSGNIIAAGLDITSAVVTYNITGTPDDPVYVIATYSSLTGAAFASVPAAPAGYTLQYAYAGNKIALVQSGGTPYSIWATGSKPFDGDANGDSVDDGLAWFLGASGPGISALDKLPVAATPTGFLTLDFDRVNPSSPAKLYVEYGNALVGWTKVEIPVLATGTHTIGGDLEVVVTSGTPDQILLKIPTATHEVGGKIFARLSAEEN